MTSTEQDTRDNVKEYYGKTLHASDELKTSAVTIACSRVAQTSVRQALADVHDVIKATCYGCGLTIPTHIGGVRILDLGSGSGRDCFAISKLVGPNGSVVGIDMTDEQLARAYKYEDYHREKFGYKKKNTQFVKGYIEDLLAAGLQDNDFDIIVSNCTVNLSSDKRSVLKEAYRVLKPGGELHFCDMYAEKRLPEHFKENKMLWGEGLAGALWWKDLVTLAKESGFTTPRLVRASPIDVSDKQAAAIVGDIKYASASYRMFKLPEGSTFQEANVTYDGSLSEYENELPFDAAFTFKTGTSVKVDGELAACIQSSRYAGMFKVSLAESSPCSTEAKVLTDPFSLIKRQACNGSSIKTCSEDIKKT